MGLLGDFAVGAAQAGEKIGLAQIQADIEENKRMRLAEFQEQLNIKSDARQEESVVRRENRGLLAATETRKQVNEETLTQRQKQFDQDNSAPNVQTSNQTATSKARAAGDIGRAEDTKNLLNKSSPQNLSAARKIAEAGRAPERASVADRRESRKDELDDKETIAARQSLQGMTEDEIREKISGKTRVDPETGEKTTEAGDPVLKDKYIKANRPLKTRQDTALESHAQSRKSSSDKLDKDYSEYQERHRMAVKKGDNDLARRITERATELGIVKKTGSK